MDGGGGGSKLAYTNKYVGLDTYGRCEFAKLFDTNETDPQFRSAAHVMMEAIRKFNVFKSKEKVFMCNEKDNFVKQLNTICAKVVTILNSEPRIARIPQPAIVIGDMNASLEDIIVLEETFWNSYPIVSSDFVFLGGYVSSDGDDKWNVEVAVYVLALKALIPNSVTLLRGNREIRSSKSSFAAECAAKYGNQTGNQIYELICDAFDRLPIAAIINGNTFCSYGGIPSMSVTINDYLTVPTPLRNTKSESPIAWQTMCAIPTEDKFQKQRIGESSTSFFFNRKLFDNFLAANSIEFVMRSNAAPQTGIEFNFDNKLITIATYTTKQNKAKVLSIFDNQICILTVNADNGEALMKSDVRRFSGNR